MNIYVIHKFQNQAQVKELCEQLKKQVFDVAFCQLSNSTRYWKRKTKTIMKKTDMVIYFVGENFSDNILFELKLADKLGLPVYLIPLNKNVDLTKKEFLPLYKQNGYGNEKKLKYKKATFEDFYDLIKAKDEALQKKLFTKNADDKEMLFEQYKLMLSTSESLVERRQKISNVYIGVCGILIPIITSFLASSNLYMIIFAPVICLLIYLLCIAWIKTITDYGKLNAAKFEIIEEIESRLPLSIFGSEWIALSRRTKRYVSFTQREKFLPKVFMGLSLLLFIAAITIFILRLTN